MPADEKIALVTETTSGVDKSSVNLELNQSQDLIDIEAPLEPGFDWTLLIDSMLWGIVLLLFLVVLLKFSKRFYQQFYQPTALRWQLKRLTAKQQDSETSDENIGFDQAWLLYAWCLKLQKMTKTARSVEDGVSDSSSAELESLLVKVNQLSFSKQSVSRETYLGLLDEAESVLQLVLKANGLKVHGLKLNSGWLSFKSRLIAMLKPLMTGKS